MKLLFRVSSDLIKKKRINYFLNKGENQFRQILVYFSFIPHTKIFTGILLFLASFSLLNILVSLPFIRKLKFMYFLKFILSFGVLATIEDALGEKWSKVGRTFNSYYLFLIFSVALVLLLLF